MDTSQIDWTAIKGHIAGLSQADLVRASESAAKQAVLVQGAKLATPVLIEALEDRRRDVDG